MRTTSYMRRVAKLGNARVVQAILQVQHASRPDAAVDHVVRVHSGADLRKQPLVLCLACFEALASDLTLGAYERCHDAECGEDATACEMCGTPRPESESNLTRAQAWRRYGR